ncbi:nitronate monooxygenase [Deinococcus metalli]|uniref:Propionate 3-nitronate monooxygenase n=1 Tax=Deinococcus metalli TaxID=1141878 RepID=A0A7W8KCB3_9DEIO|nr:nitronate monooxygenase [Deinococcus metalli]MBB5375491.1 nitronate monooxygenase [Deinococcus metalli]GHF28873.1 oxidoreductase [Deinococcus metalli]
MVDLVKRLNLSVPVVLAPMAGGVGTPALAAAVSAAGGLGSLGAAYLTPAQIEEHVADVRRRTERPLAVNLFAPQPVPAVTPAQVRASTAELGPFHAALHLPPPTLPERVQEDFGAQFAAVLRARPAVVSFAFGRLDHAHMEALRAAGLLTVGTATSVPEAVELERDGVDAVVLQGGAAGGHRGGWRQDDLADTVLLVRAAVATVGVPVIAAGGLMTAADVRAVLDAGAALAQCGTAFLLADEAGTSAPYREALRGDADTILTTAFSGRPARGLRNALSEAVHSPLPYPHQNALTRPLRVAGAAAGRADMLSLWAGTGYRHAQAAPAAHLLQSLTP